jgi:hypothetical protein
MIQYLGRHDQIFIRRTVYSNSVYELPNRPVTAAEKMASKNCDQ